MITLDTVGGGTSSASNTVTISNYTTTGTNRVLLLFSSTGNSGLNAISGVSGGGLTWIPISRLETNVNLRHGECWAAFASSQLASSTITVTFAGSNSSNSVSLASFSGVRATGSSVDGCITNLTRDSLSSVSSWSEGMTGRSKNGLVVYGINTTSGATITPSVGQTIVQQNSQAAGSTSRMAIITQNSSNQRGDSITNAGSLSGTVDAGFGAIELISADAGMVYRGQATNRSSNVTAFSTTLRVGTLQATTGNDMYEIPAGSTIIVQVLIGTSGGNVTVTDSRSNSYVFVNGRDFSGRRIELWHCINSTTKLNNGDTITVSWTGSAAGFAILAQVMYGLTTTNVIDSGTSAIGTSTTPSSGTTTKQFTNEIVIGVLGNASGFNDTFSPTPPFAATLPLDDTGVATNNGTATLYSYFEYTTSTPPQSIGFSGTFSGSKAWVAFVELYKEAATTSTVTSTQATSSTATIAGTVTTPNGTSGANPTGIVYTPNPLDPNPTITDPFAAISPFTPDSGGNFTDTLTGLVEGTTYYYGVYVTDGSGLTSYFAYGSFTTNTAIKKKRFAYKIYNSNLQYITTWSVDVISDPSFRMVVNGGAGELKVRLGRQFVTFDEGVSVTLNNRVELWCYDCDAPDGVRIYTGYISAYAPTIDDENQYVDVTILGYATSLTSHILTDPATGDTTITYSGFDPSNILRDAIDKYHDDGGNFVFYTNTSIANTNSAVTYQFIDNTIQEVINKTIQLTPYNWFWYVDANGIINMQMANIAKADHVLTIGKDLSYIASNNRLEGVVNAVEVIGGGLTPLYNYYVRASSISTYGKWLSRIQDYRITDNTTADALAKRKLDQFQTPEFRTTLHITDNNGDNQLQGANIEAFFPGQTIQVVNLSPQPILIIQSIQYFLDHIEVEASTRLPEIAVDLNNLNTQLLTLGQSQLPVAPTPRSV